MADVKWIKLTPTMFEDEKIDFIESLPEADTILIIWIKLLTLTGKCNQYGYIMLTENIPYTEEMLAHKFKRPLSVVKLALETFTRLNMIQKHEGGIYFITNWSKHQNVEGLDKIREQNKIRQAKHRNKKKQSLIGSEYKKNNVTDSVTDNITDNVTHNVTSNVTVTQGNALDIDKEIEEEEEKRVDDLSTDLSTALSTSAVDKNFNNDSGAVLNESYSDDIPIVDDCKSVLQYFSQKSGVLYPDEEDVKTAMELVLDIPITAIKAGINRAYDKFKPKHKGDKIRTLRYCKGCILEEYQDMSVRNSDIKSKPKNSKTVIKQEYSKNTFNNFKNRKYDTALLKELVLKRTRGEVITDDELKRATLG